MLGAYCRGIASINHKKLYQGSCDTLVCLKTVLSKLVLQQFLPLRLDHRVWPLHGDSTGVVHQFDYQCCMALNRQGRIVKESVGLSFFASWLLCGWYLEPRCIRRDSTWSDYIYFFYNTLLVIMVKIVWTWGPVFFLNFGLLTCIELCRDEFEEGLVNMKFNESIKIHIHIIYGCFLFACHLVIHRMHQRFSM